MASSLSAQAQNGKASTIKKTFSRTTSVKNVIQADPAIVWALLTNATDFSRWNSTIVSMEGNITPGGKIQLKSTLDPSRTFKLAVKSFVPEKELIWGDAMGKRTYTLLPDGKGGVIFEMTEKIGGPIFPLFAGKIPSFDASFEQFAADLKTKEKAVQSTRK